MRQDALGLFWEDTSTRTTKGSERPMPPVPDTGWVRPRFLPRLDGARVISIDTETYDPNLREKGPGYVRGDGYICGVSVSTEDATWYFPTRHPNSDNFDEENVFAWLRRTLSNPRQPKIGANIMYDLGWLRHHGVEVVGTCHDVQYAEPLLDENAFTYSLDSLALKYLNQRKETNTFYQWAALAFGGDPNDQRANIWRSPASLVGPYAEQDTRLLFPIMMKQTKQLRAEELYDLYKLEVCLIPLLLDMRYRGVRVDLERAEEAKALLTIEHDRMQAELDELVGFHVDVNSKTDLVEAFEAHGLPYPRTAKGAPSFTKGFLKDLPHEIPRLIIGVRQMQKASSTFIDSYVFGHQLDGRIHCSFHPLRTDDNGAVSGRFASSDPNLQNIPARDKRIGPLIRSIFLPDEGCPYWWRADYSQIEYRLLAHFAVGRGSEEVRRTYKEQPDADFHEMVARLIADLAGLKLERDTTKNVNFGLVYGMAESTLRAFLGLSEEQAQQLFAAYHEGAPFVKRTYDHFSYLALCAREVRTVLGRKRRFNLYEPATAGTWGTPMPLARARIAYGHVKPAFTHKALNSVLQGSAADIMKQAMVDAYYGGVFDVIGVPHVTVHDELGMSDDGSPEMAEAFTELEHMMERAVPLLVPVRVGVSRGANWGEAK